MNGARLALLLVLLMSHGACNDPTDDADMSSVGDLSDTAEATGSHTDSRQRVDDAVDDADDQDDAADGDVGCVPLPGAPTYTEIQTAIFNISCTFSSCHGVKKKSELDLRAPSYARIVGVASKQAVGKLLVVPGEPELSWLWHKVDTPKPIEGDQMPPLDDGLDAMRRKLLKSWIQGCAQP